jgi:polysaccharide transporter, PST family
LKNLTLKLDKLVVKNILFFYLQQFVNYLLPFLITIILNRRLGASSFSTIAISQSLLAYLIIITEFGFNLKSTKDISKTNYDGEREIFIKTVSLKSLIFLIVIIFYVVLIFNNNVYEKISSFLIINIITLLASVFNPYFLLHGKQKLKTYTIALISSKLVHFLIIFLFLINNDKILIFQYSLSFTSLCLSLYLFNKIRNELKLKLNDLHIDSIYFKKNIPFFLSRLTSMGVGNFFTVLASLIFPLKYVTFFYVLEKVVSVGSKLLLPLQEALFPVMSKKFNFRIFKRLFLLSTILSVLFLIIIFSLKGVISVIFFEQNETIFINGLTIMLLSLPFSAMYMMLGSPFLVALGEYKIFNNSSYLGFFITILICIVIFYIDLDSIEFKFYLLMGAFTVIKFIQFLYRFYFAKKIISQWKIT